MQLIPIAENNTIPTDHFGDYDVSSDGFQPLPVSLLLISHEHGGFPFNGPNAYNDLRELLTNTIHFNEAYVRLNATHFLRIL